MSHARIFALIMMLSPMTALAGATNIELNCRSNSGRTTLVASVPGDFAQYETTFTIDGVARSYYDTAEKSQDIYLTKIEVQGAAAKGSLAFEVKEVQTERFGTEFMLKFKQLDNGSGIRRTQNGERGTLRAMIQGLDPRAGDTYLQSKQIEVLCDYVYEI